MKGRILRLVTHGAPEYVQKCSCIPASNWSLEMLVFEERAKPENPGENLSEQSREPTTNSREPKRGHAGGRRALSPLHHPSSPGS